MIITCPSCGTRYRADPENFKIPGRNVRCAKCSHVWFQTPPEPDIAPPLTVPPDPPAIGQPARLGGPVTQTKTDSPLGDVRWGKRRAVSPQLQTLAFVGVLVLVATAGWGIVHYRNAIVRLWPASASVYSAVGLAVNPNGIAITNVGFTHESLDGMPVLSVTGTVVNVSNRDIPIPRLRVVLLDDSKRELYRWTFDPGIPPLSPGAESPFGTQLTSPPPDARAVDVTVDSESSG